MSFTSNKLFSASPILQDTVIYTICSFRLLIRSWSNTDIYIKGYIYCILKPYYAFIASWKSKANPRRLTCLIAQFHFKSNMKSFIDGKWFKAQVINQCKTDSKQITSQLVIFRAQVTCYLVIFWKI